MKVKSLGGRLLEKWDDVMRNAQPRHDTGGNSSGRELLLGGGGGGGSDGRPRSPWRFSTSYRESLPSPPPPLVGGVLSCVRLAKRSSSGGGGGGGGGGGSGGSTVTLLVGKDRQPFRVEPQILDHGAVQWLLERTQQRTQQGEAPLLRHDLRAGESPLFEQDIRLDCDAILFEHILWLLHNDDPAIRNLNLDELIEFYID